MIQHLIETIRGWEFIKIGTFYCCKKPFEYSEKVEGVKKTITYEHPAALRLIDDYFLKASESAYVLKIDNEIKYVGEYSSTLQDRWLRRRKDTTEWLSWHSDNLDNKITSALKDSNEKSEISLWLTVNPFLDGPNGPINISKAIEQDFLLSDEPLPFNKKGNNKNRTGLKVQNILNSIIPKT